MWFDASLNQNTSHETLNGPLTDRNLGEYARSTVSDDVREGANDLLRIK